MNQVSYKSTPIQAVGLGIYKAIYISAVMLERKALANYPI